MIYPKMRRQEKMLSQEAAYDIINNIDYGVLSLCIDGYPYAVALSPVKDNNILYFHSALEGFKTDIIKNNPRGYFLFVKECRVFPEKAYLKYSSAAVSGTLRKVDDENEKLFALKLLAKKYLSNENSQRANEIIGNEFDITAVFSFEIDQVFGKANE